MLNDPRLKKSLSSIRQKYNPRNRNTQKHFHKSTQNRQVNKLRINIRINDALGICLLICRQGRMRSRSQESFDWAFLSRSCFLIKWRNRAVRHFFTKSRSPPRKRKCWKNRGPVTRSAATRFLSFSADQALHAVPRNILIAGTRKRHASSGTPVSLGQTPIGFQSIRPRIEMCTFWKTASSSHETIIRWSYCSRHSIKNVQMLQYFLEESLVVMKGDIAGAQLLRRNCG